MAAKQCSGCGKDFECQVEDIEGCWCTACRLDKTTSEQLRAEFADCLCAECLAIYEARPAAFDTGD